MEVHPDAPTNPMEDGFRELLDLDREYNHEYRRMNKAQHIAIAEHNERSFRERLL